MAHSHTEMALTLGTWGGIPLETEVGLNIAESLAKWATRSSLEYRVECYCDHPGDRRVLERLVELESAGAGVVAVARLEPREDRWRYLGEAGVKEAIVEVPVSVEAGAKRFAAAGVERSPQFGRETVVSAALSGIQPELSLLDVTRAEERDVAAVLDVVLDEERARGVKCRFRLVDDLGLGDPFEEDLPRSLSSWIRWLNDEYGIDPSRVSVQTSDQRGLALANTLAGLKAGAGVTTSLFGLGLRTGWASTEAVLLHLLGDRAPLKALLELKPQLDVAGRRDDYRPVSGEHAWQVLGGTSPEDLKDKLDAQLGLDPRKLTGRTPEPVLTSLSGHAGMLHLLHSHYPDRHFESDGPVSLGISGKFEEDFNLGRQQPVTWRELEPQIEKSSLLDNPDEVSPPEEMEPEESA